MNQNDANAIDLNLLSTFVLLMQEKSVSRVAERLSLGQPAVSHSLARLRSLIGDPLFIRSGRAMEPTPRALELFKTVDPAIAALESAVRATQPFVPISSERTFQIAASDDIQIAYLPQVIARVSREMPRVKLSIVQSDYRQAGALLERKNASVVLGYLDKLPAAAKIRKIRRVGYKVICATPADGKIRHSLDMEDYCKQLHVLVTFAGDLVGYVDETLETLGKSRNICLSVPAFAILPFVIAGPRQLATVPAYVADILCRDGTLMARDLPFNSPEFDLSMAWPAITDKDPAEMHLRSIILDVLQSAVPGGQR